jgi:hypothetical protein
MQLAVVGQDRKANLIILFGHSATAADAAQAVNNADAKDNDAAFGANANIAYAAVAFAASILEASECGGRLVLQHEDLDRKILEVSELIAEEEENLLCWERGIRQLDSQLDRYRQFAQEILAVVKI